MQAVKTTETKIVEKIVKEEVKTNTVTLTLTEEEASQLRTMSYTIAYKYARPNTKAAKLFYGLYHALKTSGVPQASGCGCNFEHEFVERK